MRSRFIVFAFASFSTLTPAFRSAHAQALPTAVTPVPTTGLNLGLVSGTFRYDVNLSEIFQIGYFGDGTVGEQTNIGGDLAYSTKSVVRPFTALYAGGVQLSNGTGYGNTFYQSLALSQGYNTRNWSFGISDNVSYLPQSPTVGFSGVPGAGDLGIAPITSINQPSQDILTYNSTRVTNTLTGIVSRRLTPRTSLSGTGSYSILHFFNNSALNSTQLAGNVNLSHTIDARTSIGAGISYSIFDYNTGKDASFTTRGANVFVQRQLSRSLNLFASAGPQWINASESIGIPSRLTVAANAGLTYTRHFGVLSATYGRGSNGGSGVVPGAFSDSVGLTFSRAFGQKWSGSANVGYSRTSGLANDTSVVNLAALGIPNYGNFDSFFFGGQVSRRLTRSFSAYASYTAFNQSYGNVNTATPGALSGLVQSIALGINYSPRSLYLGQF